VTPKVALVLLHMVPALTALCLLPPLLQPNDGYKWTNRLLQTNPKMQEVINTLLELAYLPPHAGLHAGKCPCWWPTVPLCLSLGIPILCKACTLLHSRQVVALALPHPPLLFTLLSFNMSLT
jgi:hypothetical protein